jgi:hypothetical protein
MECESVINKSTQNVPGLKAIKKSQTDKMYLTVKLIVISAYLFPVIILTA